MHGLITVFLNNKCWNTEIMKTKSRYGYFCDCFLLLFISGDSKISQIWVIFTTGKV